MRKSGEGWPRQRTVVARINAWFRTGEGEVQSRDARRHIDRLLERVEAKDELNKRLRSEGRQTRVTVF